MPVYTVGDTPTLSHTFLLTERPSDAALCTYSVTDENGALLAGDEPAQILSIKQLPSGRYRVKVSAAVVIPDTEYDALTIDFFLRDEGMEESGSVEIDVTMDLEEPEEVLVFLCNQDVHLVTQLSFATEQDASTSALRLSTAPEHMVPMGRSFKIDIALSEPYLKDLVLTYTSKGLPPLDGSSPTPITGYADLIQGQVVIPAMQQLVSLTLPSCRLPVDGDPDAGAASHALLTFTAPEGSGIPDLRTRIGWNLDDPYTPDVMVDFRVRPFAPGDSKVTVSVMAVMADAGATQVPFDLALRLKQVDGGSGHEGIDFPAKVFVVHVSDMESTVDLPVYVSDYPEGQPYAGLLFGIANDSGVDVQLLADQAIVIPTAPVTP